MKKVIIVVYLFLFGCVGSSSIGIFGSGVSIALDPRTLGTQIDDSIMQKNLGARLALSNKKYLLTIKAKVIDGRIFVTGKVDIPEEKLQITKLCWETSGVRSVKNNVSIKGKFNFKNTAKDILITAQLRTALIFNKKIYAPNYNIDTLNKRIYIYGIAIDKAERKEVIQEAKQVPDVKDVVVSILLVSDLSRQSD